MRRDIGKNSNLLTWAAIPWLLASVPAAAADSSPRLEFLVHPSSTAASGSPFARQPVVYAVDARGFPMARALRAINLGAYLDSACTLPAGGGIRGGVNPWLALLGLGAFERAGFDGEGDVYLKVGATGLSAACSRVVKVVGAAQRLILVAGERQVGEAGSAVAVPPRVRVVSAAGKGVPGIGVSFTVVSGGGSVGSSSLLTDAEGYASTSFVLGLRPGLNTLRVHRSVIPGSAGPWSVELKAMGIAPAPSPVPAPVSLALAGPSASAAGACAGMFEVTSRDGSGQAAPVTAATEVSLAGLGQGSVYADAACAQPISKLMMPAGARAVAFYVRDLRAETLSVVAKASGLGDSPSLRIHVAAAPPVRLAAIGGDQQGAVVGAALPSPFVAQASDAFGNPVPGVDVAFAVTSGAGSLGSAQGRTDEDGRASTAFTFGPTPGTSVVTAVGAGSAWGAAQASATFQAHASAGPADHLILTGPVSSVAGECSAPFGIELRDRFGNPAPAAADTPILTAGLPAGSLFVDPACANAVGSLALAGGSASLHFFVRGTVAENLILSASLSGVVGSTLPFTVAPGAASVLTYSRQPSSMGVAGVPLGASPEITARDAYGNIVHGFVGPVALTAFLDAGCSQPAAGAMHVSVNPTEARDGVAAFDGVVFERASAFHLGAASPGLAQACSGGVMVSAAPASRLVLVQGDGQSGIAGSPLPQPLRARAEDAFGNPVAGVPLRFRVAVGDGSATPETAMTDAFGLSQANFTLGSSPGANELVATVESADGRAAIGSFSVTFVATGLPRPASRLGFSRQPSSASATGAVLASQPVVTAYDETGSPATVFSGQIRLAAYADSGCETPAPGTLSAVANPASAANGAAEFAGIRYDQPGTIYLRASAAEDAADGTSVAPACSAAIEVSSSLELALASSHSCALKDGGVKCWGYNGLGNLGDGTASNSALPVQVSGLASGVTGIAGGGHHTCAMVATGVKCWGSNSVGELGLPLGVPDSRVPVSVPGIGAGVQAIVSGDSHTCVLVDGSVRCWGLNSHGQLGSGGFGNSPAPMPVQGLPGPVHSLASSSYTTCGILEDGRAYCWGDNNYGQLGNGLTQNSPVAVRVQGLEGVKQIAPGIEHTCALLESGVRCWGHNQFGQLGDASFSDSMVPVPVQAVGEGVARLLSGGQNFNCVITASGAAKCWGHNGRGQLGDNRASGSQSNVPVQVVGMSSGVKTLRAGYIHACAADGSGLKCWGWGRSGQLGNGASVESNVPVAVQGY